MRRVLLVTHGGAVRPVQAIGMVHALGLGVDILYADTASLDLAWAETAENIGVAPVNPGDLARDDHADSLQFVLHGMSPADGYAGVWLAGLDLPGSVLPGIPRIHDVAELHPPSWPAERAALLLAAEEGLRSRGSDHAHVSARWPLALPALGAALQDPGLVGWPGALDGAEAEAWRGILERMVTRRLALPEALMLGGPVPETPQIAERVVDPVSYPPMAQVRALSLGVLPGADPVPHLRRIADLIGRGVPVLTTPMLAERFEGRWKLPVAEDPDGLAGWIDGWVEGRDVDYLRQAAMDTRAAFDQDFHAMDVFVKSLVAQVLGIAPPPEPGPEPEAER